MNDEIKTLTIQLYIDRQIIVEDNKIIKKKEKTQNQHKS